MEITKELLSYILRQIQDPEEIANLLKKYKDIENSIKKTTIEEAEALEKYRDVVMKCNEKRKSIMLGCDHPVFTYNTGPCSRDSYHSCDICGKEW